MTVLTNNAEGGTNGATVTTANSGGTSGTAFDAVIAGSGSQHAVFDTAQSAHGTLSYKWIGLGAGDSLSWSSSVGTVTEFWGRFYFRATFAGTPTLLYVYDSVGVPALILAGSDSRMLTVYDNTGATAGSFTLVANTWYRVEFHVVNSATAGTFEVRLFAGDGTTALDTITATGRNTGANAARWDFCGTVDGGGSGSGWLDDLNINTTGWPGPVVSGGAVALSAAIASTSSVAATSTQSVALSGALTSASAVAGTATKRIALAAAITSTSTVAASSTRTISLSASVASTSTVGATGTTGTQIALTASISSTSSASATATKSVAISAAIVSLSTVSGIATVGAQPALFCAIVSMSSVSASPQLRVARIAAIASSSALSGTVRVTTTTGYADQHQGSILALSRGGQVTSLERHGSVHPTSRQGAAR